jgi:hypothetical protein
MARSGSDSRAAGLARAYGTDLIGSIPFEQDLDDHLCAASRGNALPAGLAGSVGPIIDRITAIER